MVAATDGVAFEHLVVIFLKRAPRCIRAARLGASWPIKETGDTGQRLNGRPLLLTDGAGSSTCQVEESVANEVRSKEKIKCGEETYCVSRNLMLGVDRIPIYMN